MARFLFTRDEELKRGDGTGPKFKAGIVYELTGDHVARWERRLAGRVVPDSTPVGKYRSPEERAAEAKVKAAADAREAKAKADKEAAKPKEVVVSTVKPAVAVPLASGKA